jgi:hypothetical protein
MAMNVTRAPQGNQPYSNQPYSNQSHGDRRYQEQPRDGRTGAGQPRDGRMGGAGFAPAGPAEVLEQVRSRLRAARNAAQEARRVASAADEALGDAELLRRRLPVVTAAAEQALRSVRIARGITPVSLWYAGRRELAAERGRRSARLRAALAERDALVARIAEQEGRARDLRAESLRLQATASGLPRFLDEAAVNVRRLGGPDAEALIAAEAGLEPVLRRESDLDQAVRWVRWAHLHVGTALDRLGDARTPDGYRDYFATADEETVHATGRLLSHDAVGGPTARRIEAARQALAGVRDVLSVLGQALGDLGVGTDPVTDPQLPTDLEPWFTGAAADPAAQARVTAALEACEQVSVRMATLLERVEGDHAATRRVLESRRAHWCALLHGE